MRKSSIHLVIITRHSNVCVHKTKYVQNSTAKSFRSQAILEEETFETLHYLAFNMIRIHKFTTIKFGLHEFNGQN